MRDALARTRDARALASAARITHHPTRRERRLSGDDYGMRKPTLLIIAAALAASGGATIGVAPARADVSADACKAQFVDEAATRIQCDITYSPSEETIAAFLSAGTPGPELDALGAMMRTAQCRVSVDADKAEVRESWFTSEVVAIPESPVSCVMTDETGAELEVTTQATVNCARGGAEWSCETTIRETTGLSFMGGVIESMVNGNAAVSGRLETLVSILQDELGLGGGEG